MSPPRFASALSTDPDAGRAESSCLEDLLEQLDGTRPDLVVVFVTHHYGEALEGLGRRIRQATRAQVLVGCTGGSIIGGSREIEREPALSIWAAHLPGTRLRPAHLMAQRADDRWVFSNLPGIDDPERASLLLLGDPYSFPMQEFLKRVNRDLPGVPAVGGMASGGQGPGQNLLFLGDQLLPQGAIAIALEGDIEARSVVSQGCRPVSEPFVITACENNLIHKLRGESAARVMLRMLEELPEHERELFRHGPFIGLAIDANKSHFEASDFLVRNILSMHVKQGAIDVADPSIRVGQTVQFMVRDAESASAELAQMLAAQGPDWAAGIGNHIGCLLFSCGGRGTHMFPDPDHDACGLQLALGPDLPLAGFFAGGEIGQVGGHNFLHGFTASIALFRERQKD
jgi:small ligand-binding sensory domain FIST